LGAVELPVRSEGPMGRVAGDRMRLPAGWNRSRAAALGATLLLHVIAIGWLLTLRFQVPPSLVQDLGLTWMPLPVLPPPPPAVDPELPPPRVAPITAPPLPMPAPLVAPAAPADFSQSARDVAKDMMADPGYRPFGETPKGPDKRPPETWPPSIFDQPLPRVGKTVETPEGETLIWVSDYCFVSISSRSIALKEIHEGRRGVRTCILAQFGDRKKPRDDLFDPIRRRPRPQEPGCNREGVGQSCAR
jgi:hypothetical protein